MDGRHRKNGGAGWRVSLIIPAYNEEAGIGQAIAEANEALAGMARAYEILVVDDGSQDGTVEAVMEVASGRPWIHLLRHPANRGYGAALRTGFKAARYHLVAFTDADCQFHLTDLVDLLLQSSAYPVVVGCREKRQDPWQRRLASWGYNLLVRTLLGTQVQDCDCALKVFHRDVLMSMLPRTPGFLVNAEMLTRARQLGYPVAEVGVRHRPRLHGSSKVSLGDIPRTLGALIPFWWSTVRFAGRWPFPLRQASRPLISSGRSVARTSAAASPPR